MRVEERRPLVLDAALALLASGSPSPVSMEAIAARAGVAKPSVYNCFESKEALLQALAEREEKRIEELVDKALTGLDLTAPAVDLLAAGFTAILQSVEGSPPTWRLLYPTDGNRPPAVTRRMFRVRERNTKLLQAVLAAHLSEHGDEAERKAAFLAHMVAGMLDQMIELVLAETQQFAPGELARMGAELVVNGEGGLQRP